MNDNQELDGFLTDRELLMAAWTLPHEGTLTDAQRKQAMSNFADYCRRRKISFGDVGHQVGEPRGTTIRDLTNGLFREHADKHIRTLNNWIEQHARQEAAKLQGDYVDTRVAKDVDTIAKLVRDNKSMGLAHGPTGIGKSRCGRAVQAVTPGSIFITVRFGAYAPTGLIRLLADVLGTRHTNRHQTQFERILQELRGSSRLLIIDEAHKLTDQSIELVREIHDETECPVLMFATKELADRIDRTAHPDAGQVHSRFDVIHPLVPIKTDGKSSGKKLFTVEDIRKLYEHTPIRLSKDATNFLVDVANLLGWGSLRRCRVLVMNAARRARKRQGLTVDDDVQITADDLAYADSHLRPGAADQELRSQQQETAVVATA